MRNRLVICFFLLFTLTLLQAGVARADSDDWPTSLHDNSRTASSSDTAIAASTAPTLQKLWSVQTGGPIATTPTVTGGVAYFGSWDGYEYAVDAATGAAKWKAFLGTETADPICIPPALGLSSPATVAGGVVYVGGGDGYWYALDAATGGVDWRVWVSGPSPTSAYDGHYNWSGPLILNGYAYVGVASEGDCPLVQGQLLKVNLTTHVIENTANLVPNGQVGGGIWTSPAYDATTGQIFTATGTENSATQKWAQAFLAIDPATMEVTDSWKLPEPLTVLDSDFSTSTTIFTDASGRRLVASINKNGDAYAFKTSDLADGPVWTSNVAVGGECPTCGESSVSSGSFGGGLLYLAGNHGEIGGTEYPGTVRGIDPATGTHAWDHASPGSVIGALAHANGMVFAGGGRYLEVLDAATGRRLYSYDTGGQIYAGPSIANGVVYTGNVKGQVLAFALPASTTAPPADASCPSGYTCQDVGSPSPAGSESVSSGVWTVTAGGTGATGTADGLRLMTTPTDRDAEVVARVTAQPAGAGSQAGAMIRQDNSAGSPFYAVAESAGHTVTVRYRTGFGTTVSEVYAQTGPALPLYLAIQRHGDLLQAATSTDGSTYTLVPGTDAQVPMPATSLAGLFTASGTSGTSAAATFDQVSTGPPALTFQPATGAHACPSGWHCQDIGNPALTGDQTLSGGTWSISAAGGDIWAAGDQFRYIWQTQPADTTVSAQVTAQSNTDAAAKTGVMLRGDTGPQAAYYAAYVTPANGVQVQYRDASGSIAGQIANPNGAAPAYLRVTRSGTAFTAYTSTDGSTWTAVPQSTVSIGDLDGTILAGIAVTSHNTTSLGTATVTAVSVTNTAATPPNLCPTGWSCTDVGFPTPKGSQTYSAATGGWSVQGGGGDMWGKTDQFRLISQPQAYDGTVTAQVAGQSDSSDWAKSGVMVRANDLAASPYYAVLMTRGHGVAVQWRTRQDGETRQAGVGGTAPEYVRIGRAGSIYTGYTSADGVNWTAIPGSAVTITALTGTMRAGLAVCGHNTVDVQSTVFTGVDITGTGTAAGLPYPFTDTEIGSAAPAGSASFASGVFTVQGGGTDIWGDTDQLHYADQPVDGDVSMIARVTAQSGTSDWAKSGIMIKQSATAGSPYALLAVTPGHGVVFQWGYGNSAGGRAYTLPNAWLRLDRTGSVFTAYTSADGFNWSRMAQATIGMTSSATTGLAVNAHAGSLNTTTFDNVLVTPMGLSPVPSPWQNGDVGGPALPGSAGFSADDGNTFSVTGGGTDIWGTTDQMQYVERGLSGNGTITARVTAQDLTNPWAKSGIIIKESTTAGSPYVLLAVTPGNGIRLQWNYGGDTAGGTFNFPDGWLRLVRNGNVFTGYASGDGSVWTQVGQVTVAMNADATIGLFVNAHSTTQLNTTTFDNVSVAGALPSGWSDADVGSPAITGSSSYGGGVFTLTGGGNDIWGDADQFHYAYRTLTGDGSITARVASQQNTGAWAKSGVMVKQNTIAGSAYALLAVTPGNGVHVQSNFTDDQAAGTGTAPAWLRLTRSGTTVTAYVSTDGAVWIQASNPATITLTSPITIGLFVCSHNGGTSGTTTFDNVTVSGS